MKTKLLIVEDEPGLVLTLSDRLSSEGYVIQTAKDGNTGLNLAVNQSFDLHKTEDELYIEKI